MWTFRPNCLKHPAGKLESSELEPAESMLTKLRYLLLQVRNPDDPMCVQELGCFARALHCELKQIRPFDLLTGSPDVTFLSRFDLLLIGGSGHYAATGDEVWLERALDSLREIHDLGKPTFASCWGFQAFSRAMGGSVVKDLTRAELGTRTLQLTSAGQNDRMFGPLGDHFQGQMGHEDLVQVLPADAVLLASTDLVENQAYRFRNKPIYCTQFHPELNRKSLLQRLETYPEYVERISGTTMEEFAAGVVDTPETEALLLRFVQHVFG